MIVFVVEWRDRDGRFCRDEFARVESALFAARCIRGAGEIGVIVGAEIR